MTADEATEERLKTSTDHAMRLQHFLHRALTYAGTALLLAGCSGMSGEPEDVVDRPSDGQVVEIMLALHQGEIDTNSIVAERTSTEAVLEFSARMVEDHTGALGQVRALGIPLAGHTLTDEIDATVRETIAALALYVGESYDREHMDSQIRLHEFGLMALDEYLIPGAQDRQLRALLEQHRILIEAHLERARVVRAGLN